MRNLFVKNESLNYTFTQIDLSEKTETFYRQGLFILSMQMSHLFIAQRNNKRTKKNEMT